MIISFFQKGIRFKGDFHWYLAASKYNEVFSPFSIAKADLGYAFKLNSNISFEVRTEGGFSLGTINKINGF